MTGKRNENMTNTSKLTPNNYTEIEKKILIEGSIGNANSQLPGNKKIQDHLYLNSQSVSKR